MQVRGVKYLKQLKRALVGVSGVGREEDELGWGREEMVDSFVVVTPRSRARIE